MSYGIYLVHILALNVAEQTVNRAWPAQGTHEALNVASAAALLLACIFSVVAAYVMHLLVEKPCIEIGRRWSKRMMDKGRKKFPLAGPEANQPGLRQRTEIPAGKT